jgi:eukaryotic-like serine/threonine-protein kinase
MDDVVLELDPSKRYVDTGVLGEGGMAEVRACRDLAIGRIVARKLVHPHPGHSTGARVEFLREARVQGQIEHPAVPPVYDVGRDAAGEIFFTMKRVTGLTLSQVLDVRRDGDPVGERRFGRHRLLTAFQMICECIEYAHSRGVIHRDLKPSNIMFGDFGEVYVLDWGVAGIARDGQLQTGLPPLPTGPSGTPGYMAPEQLEEHGEIDRRTDVYALGALLFEILTLEPLHPYADAVVLIESTKLGADARASVRAPAQDVPPELEAICVRATALSPNDRFPTVRALSNAVEEFLEGARNLEMRRTTAARHVTEARRLLADAVAEGAARSRALGELGRALALDPESTDALSMLEHLFATPPRELPKEAIAALDAERDVEGKSASRLGGWIFAFMAVSGLVMWALASGTVLWPVVVMVSCAAAASALGFLNTSRADDARGFAMIVLGAIAISMTSGALGPLVMTPILALALALITMNVGRLSRFRVIFLILACAVVVVPAVLEWTGVTASSYVNHNGSWLIVSKVADVPKGRTYPMGLFFASIASIVGSALFAWRMADRTAHLRRELQLHVWHLRQLVPEATRRP